MEFIKNITIEDLKEFAKDNNKNQLAIDKGDGVYILSKIKFNEDITTIYTTDYLTKDQKTNNIILDENIIIHNTQNEKVGFYNFKDDNLYGLSYTTYFLGIKNEEDKTKTKTTREINETIQNKIKDKIEELINNNVENIPCTENDLSQDNKKYLEEFKKYYLTEEIQRKFFEDKEQVNLKDFINPETNISIIEYITLESTKEKEDYILQKTKEYITENKENLYMYFVKIELINNGLKKLYEDKNNILHKRKLIANICKDKKTVNVTIIKNGIVFTFKTNTDTLRRKYNTWYDDLDIQAKDRQKYKELFGWKDYTADEIEEIKYNGKTIYQKEAI